MKWPFVLFQVFGTFLLLSSTARGGEVLHVPSPDFPFIKNAIEAAEEGAVILIKPGTYAENIVIEGKSLSLLSTHGPRLTVLDGGGAGSVIYFKGVGNKTLRVEGFTITNGTGRSRWNDSRVKGRKGPVKGKGNKQKTGATIRQGEGGGLYCTLGRVYIQGNIITRNTCGRAAGMYISSRAVVRDNIISLNHALMIGGGAFFTNCEVDCYNNYFLSNLGGADGGGIYVWMGNEKIRIFENVFFECWAQYGGAIIAYGCAPVIENNIFYKNKGCRGGAILCRLKGADPLIRGNIIRGGWGCFGGGICCRNQASPVIMDNVIWENTTINPYCLGAPNSHAKGLDMSGAGIYSWEGDCRPIIANNVIFNNHARKRGGGIGCKNASPVILGNTICNNKAELGNAGINCLGNCAPVIANCIVWGNEPGQISEGAEAIHCDVQGGWPGEGNVDLEPEFVNPDTGDFHLLPDSPCKDKGGKAEEGRSAWDFEGDPRLAGAGIDLGADEIFPRVISAECEVSKGGLRLLFVRGTAADKTVLVGGMLIHEPFFEITMDILEGLPMGMEGDPAKGLPLPPVSNRERGFYPFGDYTFWYSLRSRGKDAWDLSLPHEPVLTGLAISWRFLTLESDERSKADGRPAKMALQP